jgi:WD40 repeat protein
MRGHKKDSVAFFCDAKDIASSGKDSLVLVWDTTSGQEMSASTVGSWICGSLSDILPGGTWVISRSPCLTV